MTSIQEDFLRKDYRVPLCLSSPVAVSRNLKLAEGVTLNTVFLVGLRGHREGVDSERVGVVSAYHRDNRGRE